MRVIDPEDWQYEISIKALNFGYNTFQSDDPIVIDTAINHLKAMKKKLELLHSE